MKQRELELTIAPNGEVEVHIKGFKGKACMDVAKLLEKIVGGIQSDQKTTEFYEPDEEVRLHQQQGQQ
jgi:hypothetical protein